MFSQSAYSVFTPFKRISSMKVTKISITACLLLLTGCSTLGDSNVSSIPTQITAPPAVDLQYSEIVANITASKGTSVRWGGEILSVERGETSSKVTIIEQPITETGRPDYEQYNEKTNRGRFIINVSNDQLHSRIRRNNFITVFGGIVGSQDITINDKNLRQIPVVNAQETVTWPSLANYTYRRLQLDFHHRNFYYGHSFYHAARSPFYYSHFQRRHYYWH